MKFEIRDPFKRVLLVNDNEPVRCSNCQKEDINWLHYCDQTKKVFCFQCIDNHLGCSGVTEHTDWKIDEIEYG